MSDGPLGHRDKYNAFHIEGSEAACLKWRLVCPMAHKSSGERRDRIRRRQESDKDPNKAELREVRKVRLLDCVVREGSCGVHEG